MKVVLIYSGGMDSTTALYMYRSQGAEVIPIGFDYGQRHRKELSAANAICDDLGLTYRVINLSHLSQNLKGSSQTDPNVPVPHGHYTAKTMKATIVPNRNMIMLSIAAAIAMSEGAEAVVYGAHSGDHAIYPDCRPEFARALGYALKLADDREVRLLTPFINMTKSDIAILGKSLKVPFHLTWSCYEGGDTHCGKCGTCVERNEALFDAGLSPVRSA